MINIQPYAIRMAIEGSYYFSNVIEKLFVVPKQIIKGHKQTL